MIYKISGTLLISGDQFTKYIEEESQKVATKKLMKELSVASWTVEELDTEPEDSTFACPHCGEPIRNPVLWIK